MTDRVNKAKHQHNLSVSKSKRKSSVKGGTSAGAVTTPITSFFSNNPPTKLACPLCGQLVQRYRINEHIDLQCQNFEREDKNAASTSNSVVPSTQLSPERNPIQSPARDPSSAQKEEKKETKTSPYFKKHNSQRVTREISSKSVVKTIDLWSLSSKLSRRCHKAPERKQTQDKHVLSFMEEESSEALGSSQKENLHQHLDNKEDCLIVTDLTNVINVETPVPISDPTCLETADDLEHRASKSKANHPVFSQKLPSPSSRLTKRKKGETSVEQTSAFRKKSRHERISGEAEEALSCKGPLEAADNNQHRNEEPSTASCNSSWNYSLKEVREKSTKVLDSDKLTESSICKTTKDAESSNPPRSPYYLRNFRTVLEAVLENEDDRALFNDEDLSLIHTFENLSGTLKQNSSIVF
ncbi:fanconi-associated nuclease 1-like [Polymixia lowei]